MITIISGTNRQNSKSKLIATTYYDLFKKHYDGPIYLVSLDDLPDGLINDKMYDLDGQVKWLQHLQDELFIPANKFFIISPEYNGGMPGVLKLFIDALSSRDYKTTFGGKKAGLVGVASGQAGNLRGMDQLTEVLNHLGTLVMPNKLPISKIHEITDDLTVTDEGTLSIMENHVTEFINF